MKVIIDADIIAYQASAKADTVLEGLVDKPPEELVKEYFLAITSRWLEGVSRYKPTSYLFCKSSASSTYFRHDIFSDYKSNRKEGGKPSQLDYARSLITNAKDLSDELSMDCFPYEIKGLEADDILGIAGTSPKNKDSVVISVDKDIHTLPCKIFNPKKMKRPMPNSLVEANLNMFRQAMIGDSTDGYGGIKGIGKAKVESILAGVRDEEVMWQKFIQAGTKKGLHTPEYLLGQLRLARILRYEDYSKEKGQIRLYTPPSQPDKWISL